MHSLPVRPCRRLFHLSDHQIAPETTLVGSANVVSTSSEAYTVYGIAIDELLTSPLVILNNLINFHTLN
jgi:hypothetical protein